MPDDRAPWETASAGPYDPGAEELAQLRELILGAERRRLQELERRLDAAGLSREELADLLPEAIALRAGRDRQLARALGPTVESALGESVRRNPQEIATAIFPVLGPAIRKAITEALAGLVASINSTIEHSLSLRGLRWRIESWRTGVPYAQIVLRHALVYRVEQVFLIHAETGLLLAHAWAPDLEVKNADLISGMLTAIRDFVADSFTRERETGGLRRFSVGELNLMVEQGPRAVIAVVVRGLPPESLLTRLQDTLERIHLKFAQALTDFDGDSAEFAGARPLLEECLETVVATDRKADGHRRAAWLPWAVALVALIAVLAGLRIRSERRWSAALARLEASPGIVVTQAGRSGGRWSFTGLRDPLAASPAALLAGLAVDTANVIQHWQPFISLEPPMVLARARQRLVPPAGVELALAGDTLRLRGSAPLPWLVATSRLAALPPGVGTLDLGGVEPTLPPALEPLRQAIEGERVLFDVGSAALGAGTDATLSRVAGSFRQLAAGVAALGGRATLDLVGRTDLTGSDAANQALSQDRGDAVLAALMPRGIPRAAARIDAAGTSTPLTAADSADQARINRSVSFGVSLGWSALGEEPPSR